MKYWGDSSLFVGTWTEGKINGRAWFFNGDGDVYKGEMKDDK